MKPATGFGPQALLSFPFFIFGLLALLALSGGLLARPGLAALPVRAPGPLALVHLALLGWMASFVFGAAYQLIPVIAETPLWSRSAARVHLALHVVGVPLLIVEMVGGDFTLAACWGGLVALGGVLAVFNLWMTANRRSRWTPENVGLVFALFWLAIAVGLGVLLALARSGRLGGVAVEPLLRLHMACGLAGFFVGMLFAVSFKLVPMFLLSTVGVRWRQWLTIGLLSTGLMLLAPGLLGDHPALVGVAAACLAGAGAAFLGEVFVMVRHRLRSPDWPLRTYLVGVAMLGPAAVAGLAALLGGPARWLPERPGMAMFGLVVLGVLTPCTLGMAGKIVPFLAWQWRYAGHLGRARVPLVTDLFRPALLRLQFLAVAPAAMLLSAGVWLDSTRCLRVAAAGLLVGAFTLALNMAGLVPHLLHPRLAPLAQGKRPVLDPAIASSHSR